MGEKFSLMLAIMFLCVACGVAFLGCASTPVIEPVVEKETSEDEVIEIYDGYISDYRIEYRYPNELVSEPPENGDVFAGRVWVYIPNSDLYPSIIIKDYEAYYNLISHLGEPCKIEMSDKTIYNVYLKDYE